PTGVPVGQDQLPHMELTREIGRRFNFLYGDYFPEPEAMLTPAAKCPGLDGRKMSKSYDNGIFLDDSFDNVQDKIKRMFTYPPRVKKSDPGDPDKCNLFPYHVLLATPEEQAEIREGCVKGTFGCVACKKIFLRYLKEFLEPLQQRRAAVTDQQALDILADGKDRARAFASRTMEDVRRLMRIG
ncbi:MAG: tryptophan--tRNA ligase, partial [Desulfovibrionaceae bacterium]|nr:tryptophan--tRNA ligase [Desulfovibrionaceae bacterium]